LKIRQTRHFVYYSFLHIGETDEFAAKNAQLTQELHQYKEKNTELEKLYELFAQELKKKKIDSFEALLEQDKEAAAALIELARKTQPISMKGNNVALFGLTSTGKSMMINALLGQNVAATGVGETTIKMKPYLGTGYVIWDTPGRNDEISYMSMEYISFWKGLTRRAILIEHTVKENSSMMKLLDAIELHYDIVVNKFDTVDEDEQTKFRKQIDKEIETMGLKGVDHVFFVSAKHPRQFSDWLKMVDYLATTGPK
jgi:GTP-binding protein EngB required for normal cell division